MIHCVKDNQAVLTYCGLPTIDNSIEYITFAHALSSKKLKPFDCVDCHKALTEGARHSRSPEE